MEQTWEHDPTLRISIFQVVDFLKETKKTYEEHERQKREGMQKNKQR
jgi:hypothetical protein